MRRSTALPLRTSSLRFAPWCSTIPPKSHAKKLSPISASVDARHNRVALYLRVSSIEQTTRNQRRELRQVAERHGWDVVATFEDAGISGSKGRDERPVEQAKARKVKAALALRAQGIGIRRIAREVGLGVGTVLRLVDANDAMRHG